MRRALSVHSRPLAQFSAAACQFFSLAAVKKDAPDIPSNPSTVHAYGQSWQDDYDWIRTNPQRAEEVLSKEAQHFRRYAHQSGINALARQIRAEIQSLLPESTTSTPERIGSYDYYVRQSLEQPLPCYLRCRHGGQRQGFTSSKANELQQGHEEVVLDVNELAKVYGEDVSVGQMKLSKCGTLFAFTLAESDGGLHHAFIRDLRTGQLYEQPALRDVINIEWAADGSTLLATQPDAMGRPAKVITTTAQLMKNSQRVVQSDVEVLYEENDARYFVEIQRTKDWRYLAINSNSKTSSEVHLVSAQNPMHASLCCVQKRRPGLEYFLEHRNGHLYILSNAQGASNYALFTVSVSSFLNGSNGALAQQHGSSLGEEAWEIVVPERPEIALEDLDVFDKGLVLYERINGMPQVRVFECPSSFLPETSCNSITTTAPSTKDDYGYTLPLPQWAYSVIAGANADYWGSTIRLEVSSPIHPDTALDWNLDTREWGEIPMIKPNKKSANSAIGQGICDDENGASGDMSGGGGGSLIIGHDPDDYVCERHWVPCWSPSGTPSQAADNQVKVPLTLVTSANVAASISTSSGNNPCLLVVYGAYGHNLPLDFLPERLPLLQRGWVVALLHARGGGELGRDWHAAGRGPGGKLNTTLDIEAAVDYLINNGYTQKGLIAVEASSAGGIAAGWALNRHPETFGAALLESPFVDVLSEMCDVDLPLTQHEYDEFGDPSTLDGMHALREMCPYQNMKKGGKYPPTLITLGTSDERVAWWGPLKYAAKLRAVQETHGDVFVLPDAYQSHLPGDREKYDVKALQYSFLINSLKNKV